MNQKIESTNSPDSQKSSEFSPDFIRVMVALTGATLLLVFGYEHGIFRTPHGMWIRMYLYPWVIAGGKTIANGLSEYSGQSPTLFDLAERMAALLGLLFGFIIGPTLFFFGWYNRRQERISDSNKSVLRGSGVISVVGGILTFSLAIPSIPTAYIQREVSMHIRSVQAIQSNKDQVINDINTIACDARQFRILPKIYNGSNGSYVGYALAQNLAVTEDGTYQVSSSADDVAIMALSKKYSNCSISVHVDKDGHFAQWKYSGDFE